MKKQRNRCYFSSPAIVCFLITAMIALAVCQGVVAQTFTVVNKCGYTVYPGIFPPVFQNGGWSMAPGASVSFAPGNKFNGRIWGRIACNAASPALCATGQCGGTGLQCAGTTGQVGTSLAEFNLNANGTDWYDVSYVDGMDNPIGLQISNGSCVSPSSCNGAVVSNCSSTLRSGDYCLSPCTKFNTDQFCCRNAFGTRATCVVSQWPAADQAYVTNIHNSCPNEYAYAYDDPVGLHTCATGNGNTYTITFCPAGSVGTPDFALSATPGSRSVAQGSGATYTVSSTPVNGFNGSVTLSLSGLPSGASGNFNPTSVSSPGSSTLTVSTASTTPIGSYILTIRGLSGSLSHSANATLAVTSTVPPPPPQVQINAGGPAVSPFAADKDFTGGATINHANTIDLSGVANPAPTAVYQTARIGNFTYTIPGFTAGSSHTIRLHFAETFWTAAGQRIFNVSINGTQVLTNFDVFAAAGARNKAVIRQFTVNASGSNQYSITFTTVKDKALVSGIEVQ